MMGYVADAGDHRGKPLERNKKIAAPIWPRLIPRNSASIRRQFFFSLLHLKPLFFNPLCFISPDTYKSNLRANSYNDRGYHTDGCSYTCKAEERESSMSSKDGEIDNAKEEQENRVGLACHRFWPDCD